MMDVSSETKPIRSHRDLIAWQKAIELAVVIYEATRPFPREELYGLTSQIRRSASSISANIAEGQGRRLPKEFHQFLGNARGSLLELDSHIELAFRVGYIEKDQHNYLREKINEVGRILNGLMRSIDR